MDLIGRDAELRLLTDRLRDRRLVTLVGPGGIGKTALARAAVATCAGEFGHGARVVDLTRIDSAAGVRESVAAQLGYASFHALLDAPGDLPVLLLVDNCEHVLDAAADVVDQVLGACQMPTVLATSRAALDIPGETVIPLGPLGLPPVGGTDSPAVHLFLARARDAGADPPASEPVAELCRRLDGVPLAIELAAARVRAMTPAEVLDRLSGGLDVLDRPRRRGARRHQSLQAAIAWSYDLLDAEERRLFDRLSVFAGPFTAADAHAVAGDPEAPPARTQDVLDRLVTASMVVADATGERTWYRELETLRAFARDGLVRSGEAEAVEARLADHVVDRVTGIILRGASDWASDALSDLLAMYDTIAGVLRWCTDHDARPDRALLLTAALWGVVHQAHTEETGALAEAVLARWPDTDHELRADAHATAATCRYMLGDLDGAVALAEAGLRVADRSPYAPATLRRALAQSRRAAGDAEGALAWFAETAAAARERGLVALAVEADADRGQIRADLGDVEGGLALVAAARAEAEAAGAPVAVAWTRAIEGSILLRSDVERAEAVLDGALAACRELRYAGGLSVALRGRALAALCRGDRRAASERVLDLLDDVMARGSSYELRMVLDLASPLLRLAGRDGPAADLAATARSLPVVSITASVGHELFPLDASGGEVLTTREAIVTTRAEVGALAEPSDGMPPAPERADDPDAAGEPAAADAARGDASPPRRSAGEPRVGVFRRGGDYWEVGLGGRVATVRDGKGMRDLARLLAAPGREVHCLDLAGAAPGAAADTGDAGEVLDDAARRAYEQRVRDLQAELDEAEAAHDRGRAERARAEMDAVVDQLTAALGLGGRPRRTGSAAERARSAVTQRIRSTIRRIEAVDPRLGRHLQVSVRTGTYCAYEPDEPVRWDT